MSAFVDETRIEVRSGDGGAGSTSFRREKYVPRGGPDGGDGGRGGNIVFLTRANLATLAHLRGNPVFRARHGERGRRRRMHGGNGEDLTISVPPGTTIRCAESGEILHDFPKNREGERWLCLSGGRGGLGNRHFRSSRNLSPSYAQEGCPGSSLTLSLELSLIADIGLIGPPGAGKSSLLNALTSARSKVGAYPFTTKIPHLGVLRAGDAEVVLADIPGLVRGASGGAGLGHRFLRHIGRAASLAFLADLGEERPERGIAALESELGAYDPGLLAKKRILIGTKSDLDENGEHFRALQSAFPGEDVYSVCVFSRRGLDELAGEFLRRGTRAK